MPDAVSVFRLNGLSLKSDAKTYLSEIIDSFGADRASNLVQQIVDRVFESQSLKSSILGKTELKKLIQEIADKNADDQYLKVR